VFKDLSYCMVVYTASIVDCKWFPAFFSARNSVFLAGLPRHWVAYVVGTSLIAEDVLHENLVERFVPHRSQRALILLDDVLRSALAETPEAIECR